MGLFLAEPMMGEVSEGPITFPAVLGDLVCQAPIR